MKNAGKIKRGGKALIYIAAGVMALSLVLASCGGDDGYGGGGGAVYLVSIGVAPIGPTIFGGSRVQFTATGTYSNYVMQNLTTLVTWSSSDTDVAHSPGGSPPGEVECIVTGTTIITATYGYTAGSTTLTCM